jgi:hypothetical protein
MVRDINAGRFNKDISLVLLTHGLALRIFLMRWFQWTVDEFLNVFNPPNAEPLVWPRQLLFICVNPNGPVLSALWRLPPSCINRISSRQEP